MTSIKKRIGFDNMSMTVKFKSGANFKYSIGRSGKKLQLAFSNDSNELKNQMEIFQLWLKKENLTHEERFSKLETLCNKCNSGKELIELMK